MNEQILDRIYSQLAVLSEHMGLKYDCSPVFPLSLDTNSESFSLEWALALARASALSYEAQSVVRSVLAREDRALSVVWLESEESDTQGFIAHGEDLTLLIFRGTESIRDVKFDAKFAKEPFTSSSEGNVHSGFKKAIESVWPQIRDSIDGTKPLWVAGHSLGGALATLAATRISADMNIQIAGLYTIGQPRVGDYQFASYARELIGPERIFRIHRGLDPISQLPFPFGTRNKRREEKGKEEKEDAKSVGVYQKDDNWQHVSGNSRCFFTRKGRLTHSKSKRERALDRFLNVASKGMRMLKERRVFGINDHSCVGYVALLRTSLYWGVE